jgi:hypothetical protein
MKNTLETFILWILTAVVVALAVEVLHMRSEMKDTDEIIKSMLIMEKARKSTSGIYM